MPTVLDTTVVIDLLRGRPGAARRIEALRQTGDVPYVCAITAEEVQRGLRPGEEARASLVLTAFRVAPLGVLEGALAGAWRRDFERRGISLGRWDCLIAASAVGVHATLATGNPRHFPMEGLTVEHWPAGE